MNSVIINNDLYASAVAGITTLNGMYIFYGEPIATPASGATVATLAAAVTSTTGAGMARCYQLMSSAASGAVFSSTTVISGSVRYMTTTANAEVLAGVPITPGITVNALGLAHLTPNAYDSGGAVCSRGYLNDTLLDYSVISSGGVVVPAGGYITLVDNLSIVSGV